MRPLGRSTRAGRPRSVSVHISPGSAGILPAGRPRSVSVHISPGSAGILPAGHPRSRVCPVVGARAAYPRPLHVGGTPALPGACVPPGANSYLAPWQTSQNGNERPCTVQSVPPDLISALSSQSAVLTTKRRTAVLGSQFSVLSSWFSVLGSQFLVLSSWFSVPGSHFSALGSQFLVLTSPLSITPALRRPPASPSCPALRQCHQGATYHSRSGFASRLPHTQ